MAFSLPTLRPAFAVLRRQEADVRPGNWLTTERCKALWQATDNNRTKGKLDRALLVVLLVRGLGRYEAVRILVAQCEHTTVAATLRIACSRDAGRSIDWLVQLSPATEFTSWNS